MDKYSNEEWCDVVGYDGMYQVSSYGRVKSKIEKTRIGDKENRILKQKTDTHGYYRVNLYKNGISRAELVSKLVANAFIPNPIKLTIVGHEDDIKTNNHVSNLYWTDAAENNRHNGKLEKFHDSHREKIDVIAKKLSQRIRGIALDGSPDIFYESMQRAKLDGFDEGKISMCINGKRNKHKGYRWERDERY